MSFIVDIPAGFVSKHAIFEPVAFGPEKPSFKIYFPGEASPVDIRNKVGSINVKSDGVYRGHASSSREPVIVVGDGNQEDERRLDEILSTARRWGVKPDEAVSWFPMRASLEMFEITNPMSRYRRALGLTAVQIVGPFPKPNDCAPLQQIIANRKAMLEME